MNCNVIKRLLSKCLLNKSVRFVKNFVFICIYQKSWAGCDMRLFLNFFFYPRPMVIPRVKSKVCPIIYPWKVNIWFIPFPRVLGVCKMQTASFMIWTQVVVFLSSDDNHYTTTSFYMKVSRFQEHFSSRYFAFSFSFRRCLLSASNPPCWILN